MADQTTAGKRPTFQWLVVLAGTILLIVLGVFGYQYWKSQQIPVLKQMGDFTLENTANGQPFRFQEANGKVRLISFIFTNCPDVCPATTQYMSKMQDELKAKGLFGEEVVFLTISFDPERDTAEVLQEYAAKFNADPAGWYFLRGSEADVQQVTQQYGIGVMKEPSGNIIHTMRTFLVDKEGNLRRMYGMGAGMDLPAIVKDMEQLAEE